MTYWKMGSKVIACEIIFLSYGSGYAWSGADSVESEPAAAGSVLGAGTRHRDGDRVVQHCLASAVCVCVCWWWLRTHWAYGRNCKVQEL